MSNAYFFSTNLTSAILVINSLKMKQRLILYVFFALPLSVFPRIITIENNIYWGKAEETIIEGSLIRRSMVCNPCLYDAAKDQLPEIFEKINLSQREYIKSVVFRSVKTEIIEDYNFSENQKKFLTTSYPVITTGEGSERGLWKGMLRFTPLIQKNGRVEKVTYYQIEIEIVKGSVANNLRDKSKSFGTSSVLSTGEWYKIGIVKDAVYKLSYKFLQQQGIDVDNIDPRNLAVFGNGSGMLPRKNSDPRIDDLAENSILVIGEQDGVFNKNDYILFYAEGPNEWDYDAGEQKFKHLIHQFSDTSYYFLKIGSTAGKRVLNSNFQASGNQTLINEFNDYAFHEVDKINLLKSGDDWLGESFDIQNSHNFSFSFPNLVSGSSAFLLCSVATASKLPSTYTVTAQGKSMTIDARSAPGGYGQRYAQGDAGSMSFNPTGNVISVTIQYNKPAGFSSAKGYLDYISLNVRRKLILSGIQMKFREINSIGNPNVQFNLGAASAKTQIWDISDPINPIKQQSTLNNGILSFTNSALTLKEYIAVSDFDSSFFWRGSVQNQNLHAENSYNYVIISNNRLLPAAERLASIHRSNDLSVFVVTPQEIYNEFSSGAQDIVALRDFLRMLYHKGMNSSDQLKYVLLMGDGSYDNKYRLGGNTNLIPSFQSNESYDPTQSYVTDDFYCLLDSNEGTFGQNELMDVGIGRIPAQTLDQANKVVDKIQRYLSADAKADWRNTICFVADDEDNNIHMRDANSLAIMVDTMAPNYNIEKIFIDAYKQYSTPGGQRYPDAFEAIKRQVERGALIVGYTGHGGEVGWAHERILTMDVINNWKNRNSMPLFLTATCEFSRWDDPQRAAGGEVVLLNPEGGGIALLTTVRLVYSFANQQLALSFYQNIFKADANGNMPHLGDVYREVKNSVPGTNSRNFTLLGDPALIIAYPNYTVVTDSINGMHISTIDTLGALGLVEVKGHLEDNNGNKLSNFNGTVYPTVFDKEFEVQSLNNDGVGIFPFPLQNKKLFRGKANVSNGDFSFKFVVPKDIAYNFGNGRLSYYSENQIDDASGFSYDFIVGGTDKNAAEDNVGPDVELYMNDETFIYGGITDENPLFLAKLFDVHGINMAGTGIGHDLTAILDDKTDNPIILNDYYSATLNSYQEGEIRYPLEGLEPGTHKIALKVWDVYNNSSEKTLEFVVQEFKEISIDKVLNYPNPFTTNTSFWFEHNQPNTVLDVKVQVFTISGKIVKTIDRVIETIGYNQNTRNPINWNGRDEYGDKLGRGVYVYKLQVRSRRNGSIAEKIEKLVIL